MDIKIPQAVLPKGLKLAAQFIYVMYQLIGY